MQAKAQVIPFEEEMPPRQGAQMARPRKRPIPPGGAEVLVFRPKGAHGPEEALQGEPPRDAPKRAPRSVRHAFVGEESGQGTTEYAILVGVLVVIAIMAILIFRDKVQELWNAIADGINSL